MSYKSFEQYSFNAFPVCSSGHTICILISFNTPCTSSTDNDIYFLIPISSLSQACCWRSSNIYKLHFCLESNINNPPQIFFENQNDEVQRCTNTFSLNRSMKYKNMLLCQINHEGDIIVERQDGKINREEDIEG